MNPHLHAVPGIDENGEVTHSWPTSLPECWRLLDLQAGTMAQLEEDLQTETVYKRAAKSEATRYKNLLGEHRREEEGKEKVREVLGYWRERVSPRAEIAEGDDRWEKVRDRLGLSDGKYTTRIDDRDGAGFTVEELKLTVDGALLSEWHCGKNDKGKTYLDAASIFGTTKRVRDHSARALEAQEQAFEERLVAHMQKHPCPVYEAVVAERQAQQLFELEPTAFEPKPSEQPPMDGAA